MTQDSNELRFQPIRVSSVPASVVAMVLAGLNSEIQVQLYKVQVVTSALADGTDPAKLCAFRYSRQIKETRLG